ncbi:uncharacterized protein LOC144143528 [Haemaphysalis longicornis]
MTGLDVGRTTHFPVKIANSVTCVARRATATLRFSVHNGEGIRRLVQFTALFRSVHMTPCARNAGARARTHTTKSKQDADKGARPKEKDMQQKGDSGSKCSVEACNNTYANTAGKLPKIKFYVFPSKPYEKERRRLWIRAVRRASVNGALWEPTPRKSVICSAHFVGNKKSADALHPAYVPTIFPAHHSTSWEGALPASKLERYERAKRRSSLRQLAATSEEPSTVATSYVKSPGLEDAGELCSSRDNRITFKSVARRREDHTMFLSGTSHRSVSTQACSHPQMASVGIQAEATRTTSRGTQMWQSLV